MDRRAAIAKATITTTVAAGGLLEPEQSTTFLWRIKEQSDFGKSIRQVQRRASAGEINKAFTNSRIIRRATENSDDGYRAEAEFPTISYSAVKIRLPWEVTEDTLHENIEGTQLEADLVSQMTAQFSLDLDDLDINGDTAAGAGPDQAFLQINDGIRKQILAGGSGAHVVDGSLINAGSFSKAHLFAGLEDLPRRYRQNRGALRWIANDATILWWEEYLTERAGAQGDAILVGSQQSAIEKPLRVPWLEVPSMPDGEILLTVPKNIVRVVTWDVRKRKVTGETDKELAATDKRFYVFHIKEDVIVEEMDAVVYITGLVQ